MRTIAHATDVRAAFADGTVKKRIKMCGKPAVPSTSANPREMRFHAPIGPRKSNPGSSKFDVAAPVGTEAAAEKKLPSEKLKWRTASIVRPMDVTSSSP